MAEKYSSSPKPERKASGVLICPPSNIDVSTSLISVPLSNDRDDWERYNNVRCLWLYMNNSEKHGSESSGNTTALYICDIISTTFRELEFSDRNKASPYTLIKTTVEK
jgi:hypothetical protein